MGTFDRIGNYRVERVLGAGSFATVWLAVDEVLESTVAIKVLADNWARQPDIRRRFIDEAKILRRLDHDGVVRIFQVDELPDGRPYFVMTWADRGALFDKMQERSRRSEPFSVDEAIGLTIDIAECLRVVHAHGVVHRDIKPSNVLFRSITPLRRAGAAGPDERMLLGDFGLAKDLAGASGFTFAAGTPAYMAPEQARTGNVIDERADIFAVCAVLYELLAGRPAFAAETLSGVGRSHTGAGPAPLGAVRPDAPPYLEQIIRHGLAPDPTQRIASADALIGALRGVLDRTEPAPPPVAAAPPPTVAAPPSSQPPAPAAPAQPAPSYPPVPGPPLSVPPAPASGPASGGVPASPLVLRTAELLDGLQQRTGPGAAAVLDAARRRLAGPLQIVVTGPADPSGSELAWVLAGERLSPHSNGGHGVIPTRLQGGPGRQESAVAVLHNGSRYPTGLQRDTAGALAIVPAGPLGDVAGFEVFLGTAVLGGRVVTDIGMVGGPGASSLAAMSLREVDLLVVVLPALVEAGRTQLQGLAEVLRRHPSGPVVVIGIVSPGPGNTLGAPGSLPGALAAAVAAYQADPVASAMLALVTALADGRAPVVDGVFEALARHGEAVRVTAALAMAEDGLGRVPEPGARVALDGLAEGRDTLVAAFPAVEELAVLRDEAAGRLALPGTLRAELRRVLAGGDPAARLGLAPGASATELRTAAEAALERWRTLVNTGRVPYAAIDAALAVTRALERLWSGSLR